MPDPTPAPLPADGPPLRYDLIATDPDTRGRRGRVRTRHGVFDTPAFMPVGTKGTLKGLLPAMVAETGARCVLTDATA